MSDQQNNKPPHSSTEKQEPNLGEAEQPDYSVESGDFASLAENLSADLSTPTSEPPFIETESPQLKEEESTVPADTQEEVDAEKVSDGYDQAVIAASSPAEILAAELLKSQDLSEITPTEIGEQVQVLSSLAAPEKESESSEQSDSKEEQSNESIEEVIAPTATTQPVTEEATSSTEVSIEPEVVPVAIIDDEGDTTKRASIKSILRHPSALMLLSAFLFSSMILFVKLASEHYNNFEIISFRGFIGVICILGFQFARKGFQGIRDLKTEHMGMHAWRSFIGTSSMMCWFYGISKLSLALATTLNYMSSIWMAIFIISTAFFTGTSRPSFKLVLSIMLGFAGIVIVLRPTGVGTVDMVAATTVIIGSVFGALAYMQVAALGKIGEPAYRTVFYFSLFGAIAGLVVAYVHGEGQLSDFSWMGMLWLIPIGFLAMLAQICLTLAYTGGNTLVNASLQYSGLIFAVFFDWVLRSGWPDYIAWLGMALVVGSGLLATLTRAKKQAKKQPTLNP